MSVGEVSTLVTRRATKWASVFTAFKGHTNVEAYVVRARARQQIERKGPSDGEEMRATLQHSYLKADLKLSSLCAAVYPAPAA